MKHQPARGAQARYTRALHEQLTQRERVVTRALGELAPLWAGDHVQLGEALGRLMSALPLELDTEQLLAFGRVAQEHATKQARVLLAAARRGTQRRDADDLPRRMSTIPLTLWDEDKKLREQTEEWVTKNAAMIQGLDEHTRTRIVKAVQRAGEGSSLSELSSFIVDVLDRSRRNAELLARDQVGRLASDTAQYQMELAGVTSYIWRVVGDERTRPEHRARDGEVFSWATPPADGHPGQAPLCRCYAEPLLDEAPPHSQTEAPVSYPPDGTPLPPDLHEALKNINPNGYIFNCSQCAAYADKILELKSMGMLDDDAINKYTSENILLQTGADAIRMLSDMSTIFIDSEDPFEINDDEINAWMTSNTYSLNGDYDELAGEVSTRSTAWIMSKGIITSDHKRGIVIGNRGVDEKNESVPGHVFNFVNIDGVVIFFDAQGPSHVDPSKFKSLTLIKTE